MSHSRFMPGVYRLSSHWIQPPFSTIPRNPHSRPSELDADGLFAAPTPAHHSPPAAALPQRQAVGALPPNPPRIPARPPSPTVRTALDVSFTPSSSASRPDVPRRKSRVRWLVAAAPPWVSPSPSYGPAAEVIPAPQRGRRTNAAVEQPQANLVLLAFISSKRMGVGRLLHRPTPTPAL